MANTKETEWLEGISHYPVYYEDTDFSGNVYHANYLKYFERAREDLIGIGFLRDLFHQGYHWVVARMNLKFQAPAQHGDTVWVDTAMQIASGPVCDVKQTARDEAGRTTYVTADLKLAFVTGEGRLARTTDEVREHLRSLALRDRS